MNNQSNYSNIRNKGNWNGVRSNGDDLDTLTTTEKVEVKVICIELELRFLNLILIVNSIFKELNSKIKYGFYIDNKSTDSYTKQQ